MHTPFSVKINTVNDLLLAIPASPDWECIDIVILLNSVVLYYLPVIIDHSKRQLRGRERECVIPSNTPLTKPKYFFMVAPRSIHVPNLLLCYSCNFKW